MSSSIHHFSQLSSTGEAAAVGNKVEMPHSFGAMFTGPGGRTADDFIVDLVELRCGGGVFNTMGNDGDDSEAATYYA